MCSERFLLSLLAILSACTGGETSSAVPEVPAVPAEELTDECPLAKDGEPIRAVSLSTNCNETFLALLNDGSAICWGENWSGECGFEGRADEPRRSKAVSCATQVSLGVEGGLMLHPDGTVWGWGNNLYGTLTGPDPTFTTIEIPVRIPGLPPVRQIWARTAASVISNEGEFWWWGLMTKDSETSYRALLPEVYRFRGAVADTARWCALLQEERALYCWGANGGGQLGDGTKESRWEAKRVNLPEPVIEVFAAGAAPNIYAILESGAVWGWGTNAQGNLAVDPEIEYERLTPGPIPLPEPVRHVSACAATTCAVTVSGSAYCWGNYVPIPLELPDGVTWAPRKVVGLERAVEVAVEGGNVCFLLDDGGIVCGGQSAARGHLHPGNALHPVDLSRFEEEP